MKTAEKILVLCVFAAILAPGVIKVFPLVKEKPLSGDFTIPAKPPLSIKTWTDGSFQDGYEPYISHHIGLRNTLFRLANQLDYNLFGEVRAEGIIKGENNFLFEYDYIRSYTGTDYVGDNEADIFIRRLKFLQEHFKKEHNIDLIFVLEPDKARFMPENIPERYLLENTGMTNYEKMAVLAEHHGVLTIDLNKYFLSLKDETPFPLYTRYGTHWSLYGMSLAADSLIRFIEQVRGVDLPDYSIVHYEKETASRKPDYDMGNTMNLFCRLPEEDTVAYPVYDFAGNKQENKQRLLVIGDSYFWNILNTGIPYKLFSKHNFWYFNHWVYPESYRDTLTVKELNLMEELLDRDVILLMITTRFLYKQAWGFVDNLYEMFAPPLHYNHVRGIKSRIYTYDTWFNTVLQKAEKSKIPLAEQIDNEAWYLYRMNNLNDYLLYHGPEHYRLNILSSSQWSASIRKKAEEKGIAFEDMVNGDANYMFEHEFPDLYQKHALFKSIKAGIRDDTVLLSALREKAAMFYMTDEEIILSEAEAMIRDSLQTE